MIETIYSNESGEANHTNRVQATFKMPKNIRQVGKSNVSKKIYVEDYVMTFIKQIADKDYSKCKVAVLVGQYLKTDECRNIFISGAIEVEGMDTMDDIHFVNDVWAVIYENIKKYFVDTEIVGWFIGAPGYMLEDRENILKIHLDNFSGTDKTLLLFDTLEKEEAFLFYENSSLSKQEGYYIYYEKNEDMQTYMIENRNSPSGEVAYEDRVSKEIRTVIQNKNLEPQGEKSTMRLMYAAGTLLAVIILVVGAAILTNYDQMRVMQKNLNYLTNRIDDIQTLFTGDEENNSSANVNIKDVEDKANEDEPNEDKSNEDKSNEDKPNEDKSNENNLDVEVVEGEVKPIDDGETAQEETPTSVDNEPEESANNSDDEENETQPVSASTSHYIVETGDTLAGISWKLYGSWNYMSKIKELNNIDDADMIYVGQKLIVP